jgi:hypothetical protein
MAQFETRLRATSAKGTSSPTFSTGRLKSCESSGHRITPFVDFEPLNRRWRLAPLEQVTASIPRYFFLVCDLAWSPSCSSPKVDTSTLFVSQRPPPVHSSNEGPCAPVVFFFFFVRVCDLGNMKGVVFWATPYTTGCRISLSTWKYHVNIVFPNCLFPGPSCSGMLEDLGACSLGSFRPERTRCQLVSLNQHCIFHLDFGGQGCC